MRKLLLITWFYVFSSGMQAQTISDFSWLIGTWVYETPAYTMTEVWTHGETGQMLGRGVAIAGSDTVFSEDIQLNFQKNGIFYLVSAKGQNGNEWISFELKRPTNGASNSFVFENPEHDYPTKIVYERRGDDHLLAWISGMKNGVEKREEFSFSRKK